MSSWLATSWVRSLGGIELTAGQEDLLAEHDHVLRLLDRKPLTSLAVCPSRGGWVLDSGGAGPTRCKTTWRCEGKPKKASAAKAATDEEPDLVPPVETVEDPTV